MLNLAAVLGRQEAMDAIMAFFHSSGGNGPRGTVGLRGAGDRPSLRGAVAEAGRYVMYDLSDLQPHG